jgi:hypothetical protein
MHYHFIGNRIANIVPGGSADNQLRKGNINLLTSADCAFGDSL